MGARFTSGANWLQILNNLGINGGAITMMLGLQRTSEIGSGSETFMQQNNNSADVTYQIVYEYNGGSRRLVFRRVKQGVGIESTTYTTALSTSPHHIAMTYDGSNMRGYLDSALVAGPTAASGNGSGTTTNLFELPDNGGGAFTAGEARIWTTALSESQIATERRSLQPVFLSNLIYWGPYDNAVLPSTYNDFIGGFDMTINGTVTPGQSPSF